MSAGIGTFKSPSSMSLCGGKQKSIKQSESSDSNTLSTNTGWMNPQVLKAVFDMKVE